MPLPACPWWSDPVPQARHYDWKLRAIKTTLYVAGGMKRAAPHLSEDKVRRLDSISTLALLVLKWSPH